MAFQPRTPRVHDKLHLVFIRQLPCIACAVERIERFGVDACHVRHSFPGWTPVGGGEKPSDFRAFPACRPHHDEQHDVAKERVWWARLGVNPVSLCADLVAARPSVFNGSEVIRDHAERARRSLAAPGRAGGLTDAVCACPPQITISAHLAGLAPDADGNVAVLVPLAAGDTLVMFVAPDCVSPSLHEQVSR